MLSGKKEDGTPAPMNLGDRNALFYLAYIDLKTIPQYDTLSQDAAPRQRDDGPAESPDILPAKSSALI